MNFSIKLLFIVSIFLVSCFHAQAVEVENLYTGKILVTDKRQKTRVKAHRWAIEQVLAKVTGNREILKDKTIQREVRLRTANYIKSFTFVTDEQDRIFLVDQFDQKKIDRLLRNAGASIWGKRRPRTLIWLAIEEGLQRNLVRQIQYPQLSEMIQQSADDRGLPVLLPDVGDGGNQDIFPSDVWARFDRIVAKATEQYDVENYLMARMHYQPSTEPAYKSGWRLEFQLMAGTRELTEGQFVGEQFEVIRDMSNAVGDYYAAQYAIKSEKLGSDEIYLSITGISSLVSLVEAEKYLSSLPPVSAVEMYKLSQQVAQFKLFLSGEGLDVIKALALLPEFEQVMEEDIRDKPQTLSVEQQLEKLTRDYYNQIEAQRSTTPAENSERRDVVVKLKYHWLGKS